jgi:4-hydroxybenzoate polyprenyltransferase
MNGRLNISDWFGLFRIPNLLIITLTQTLAWLFIIRPLYHLTATDLQLSTFEFILLVLSTVMIAAAGYVVNDIYDIDVDHYNKRRNIIGSKLSIPSAWWLYAVFNTMAIVLGFYLSLRAGSFQLGFIFVVTAGLLYLYSSRYQHKLLWGNLVVSFSSTLVILIVWLFEFMYLRENPDEFITALPVISTISEFIWSYALFGFLVSLIREIIKDAQDIEGDRRFGSYSLVIAIGIPATRYIIGAGILLSMILLAFGQYHLMDKGFRYAFWFLTLTVQFMFLYLLINIFRTKSPADFSSSSQLAKYIMLAGVLSMQLIYLDIS